jgi:hypothetical protein
MLPFCPTDTGTNLESQTDYAADTSRTNGNQPGVASSKLINKALRQSAWMASQLAQYIVNTTGLDVLDDQNSTNLQAAMSTAFVPNPMQSQVQNLTLNFTVAGNAGTVAVKTYAGTDAVATNPINVALRSATITNGSFNLRSITSALSMTITSGATLGQTNGNPSRIYVYLIDNSGTLELAVSHSFFSEAQLISTTAMSSGASSVSTMYSTTARSNVPFVCIGYILNTQATAGTWLTTASQIQLLPIQGKGAPTTQKFSTAGTGTYVTPPGVLYLRVRMVGAGGGGGGSGTGGGTAGNDGGASSFGSFTVGGGLKGTSGTPGLGGAGGSSSGTTPSVFSVTGGPGGSGSQTNASSTYTQSGAGGTSFLGGNGPSQGPIGGSSAGVPASANTGSGGSGGGSANVASSFDTGPGGGAGGYLETLIPTPASNYTYTVGAKGTGGIAGTSGYPGGNGADGLIIIDEFYQ